MTVGKILVISLLVIVAAVVVMALVVALRTPSHDGNWKAEYRELPRAEFTDQGVTLHNVRDFRYNSDGTVREERYIERALDPDGLDSLWYGISHFTTYGLAHTFLSFGFADGGYLTLSFEARQEVDQRYDPLRGLLGAYELILVASEERDVIGRRTHLARQDVLLYRVELAEPDIRRLFDAMMGRINQNPRQGGILSHDHGQLHDQHMALCATTLVLAALRQPQAPLAGVLR